MSFVFLNNNKNGDELVFIHNHFLNKPSILYYEQDN